MHWELLFSITEKDPKSEENDPLRRLMATGYTVGEERAVYTVFQKKQAPWCLIYTLANVNQFSKFFHQVIRK